MYDTLDALLNHYKLLGPTNNATKTKVLFHPAQPLTATAPNIGITQYRPSTIENFPYLGSYRPTSRSRQTKMSKFNTGSDVRALGRLPPSHESARTISAAP